MVGAGRQSSANWFMEAILHGSEGGESMLNATGMVPKLPTDLDTILDDGKRFLKLPHLNQTQELFNGVVDILTLHSYSLP